MLRCLKPTNLLKFSFSGWQLPLSSSVSLPPFSAFHVCLLIQLLRQMLTDFEKLAMATSFFVREHANLSDELLVALARVIARAATTGAPRSSFGPLPSSSHLTYWLHLSALPLHHPIHKDCARVECRKSHSSVCHTKLFLNPLLIGFRHFL